MARKRHIREIPLDEQVRRSERWTTSVSWPAPVDQRLSALVDLAIEAGEPDSLSRAELLAALVCSADASGAALREALGAYRTAKVGQIALTEETADGGGVVRLSERRPGRR